MRDGREGGSGGDAADGGGEGDVAVAGSVSRGDTSSLLPELSSRIAEPAAITAANPMIKGSLDERRSFRASLSSSYAEGAAKSGGE
jgi:hypothetical protein